MNRHVSAVLPPLGLLAIVVVVVALCPARPALAQGADEPGLSPGASGGAGSSMQLDVKSAAGSEVAGRFGAPTPPFSSGSNAATSGLSGQVGGAAMFERIDEDYFVTIDIFNNLTIGPVTFGLWVPLRLRVWDQDPEDDGVLRDEDWDEVSDYARLLRFVELNLGGESWRFRGRFGALEGESLGHGTILAGYYNCIDRDHYQAGLVLDLAIPWGGVTFILDNLLAPEIFGVRLHTRPASFVTDNVWANKLIVGASVVMDTAAPEALGARPVFLPGMPTLIAYEPILDDENNYEVASRQSLAIAGVDLEYQILRSSILDIIPYADLNFLVDTDTGVGFHLGTFVNVRIPTFLGPTLLTRLEYRVVGDGYAPRYIDTTYEAQRIQYDGGATRNSAGLPVTKLEWLRGAETGTHGWLGEAFFDFAGWVVVGGTFEDYEGPDNAALTLSLSLPKLKIVQAGALYSRRGFDGLDGVFDLDGALLLAWARVSVYGPVGLTASYSRTWHASEDGTYQTTDDWGVGVSLAFSY